MNEKIIRVGVGLLIIKDGKILLGKRKSSHGVGEYGGPGGHAEYGETLEQTATRELGEECGIEIVSLRLLCVTDLLRYMPRHYMDIGFTAETKSGEPKVLEPSKLESWGWYDIDAPPSPLFGCTREYIESYKTGQTHFVLR